MEMLALYLKASGFGVAVAAPVGPMSLLCMRRTLTLGWPLGLATGVGIATADGLYALVAALGLAGVSRFLLAHEQPLHIAAGLFLVYLGLRTFFSHAEDSAKGPVKGFTGSWQSAYAGSVLLTLTNPPTIIMFAAIFAGLAPRGGFEPVAAVATTLGVFTGSLLWWCGITAIVSGFRHTIGRRVRSWIDRGAGLVLGIFGVVELRRAL